MESSPLNEMDKKVDLCTPTENLHKHCQEITPDNPIEPDTRISFGTKKSSEVGSNQKLSKRKLFEQPVVGQTKGDENVSEMVYKKKLKSDDTIRTEVIKDSQRRGSASGDCAPGKRPLTERQQLAFLLEATSSRESQEDETNSKFTKIKPRKRIKRNGKCVNPRVYRRNERGETPLHLAAIKGDIDGLRKLFKDGAEVGVKDYAGWTALHEACNHGNLAAAKLLVKRGAHVNVPGFEGDTPLHDAVVNNHVEVVTMLLSCGADPHQTNMKRKKPLDLINSSEMSNTFNSHGIHHSYFEQKDAKTLKQDVVASSNNGKSAKLDCERSHARGSILGNEIQRKETQGESKMEKPVMYICKLEPTLCTTQVTTYKKCSKTVQGGDGAKSKDSVDDKEERKVNEKELSGSSPLQKDATEVRLRNEKSSHQVGKLDSIGDKKMTYKLTSLTSQRNQTTGISGNMKDAVGDRNNDLSRNNEDELNQSQEAEHLKNEQFLNKVEDEGNDIAVMNKPEKSFINSEDIVSSSDETEGNAKAVSERSRTPEIDESIAVEVLATGLFSTMYAHLHGSFIEEQPDVDHRTRRESSESQPEMMNIGFIYDNMPASKRNEGTSVHEDDPFLDVEHLEPDQPSTEVKKFGAQLQGGLVDAKRNIFCKKKTKAKDETSKIVEQTVNKFMSGDATSARSAGMKHNSSNWWRFDDVGSEKDGEFETVRKDQTIAVEEPARKDPTIGYNTNDFQRWNVEKKSKGRKKISAGNTALTRKDKISRRKTEISRNPEVNARYEQPESQRVYSSKINGDGQRLEHGVETVVTTKPAVSWQSLVAAGKSRLSELSIPGYDEFLMKTKRYDLAMNSNNDTEDTTHFASKEDQLSAKYKKTKRELLKKQKSELDKLQLSMELEIVRLYKNQAYAFLKCNQPASACSAIHWQNMSKHQLENEKSRLSQQQFLPMDQNTAFGNHREIVKKYENLKTLMTNRHKHEQESLDAVVKLKLESCV